MTLIRKATLEDLKYVVDLSNKENHAIGFIPKQAYESAVTGIKEGKRWSNKCNDKLWIAQENGDTVGFLLGSFGTGTRPSARRAKVAQICLQQDARKLERGRALLDEFIKHGDARGVFIFGCGCADDLESNLFWQAMGWTKEGQRRGIGHGNTWVQSSDRKVNIYAKRLVDLFNQAIGNAL